MSRPVLDRRCSIFECDGAHEARGYCRKHYKRLRKTGSPLGLSVRGKPTVERFWIRLNPGLPNDCWEWPGARQNGYGVFAKGPYKYAHRTVWVLTKGLIPEDLTIDHLCRNRSLL